MENTDISHLPPEVQQSIKTRLILNQIEAYGKEIVKVEGFIGEKQPFMHLKNIRVVDRFVILDKGCETWVVGEKYPLRFALQNNKIDTIHRFKRLIPIATKSFKKSPILSSLYFLKNWKGYVDFLHNGMKDVYFSDQKYYSQPIREFYRVFTKLCYNTKLRDIWCALLEFDTAYRYRIQDIFVEINKEDLRKNPTKEIQRVLSILFRREISLNNGLGKFKTVVPFIFFYLKYINRRLLGKIVDFLFECDMREIQSSVEDLYWQNAPEQKDYNYRGLSSEERVVSYLREKNTIKNSSYAK